LTGAAKASLLELVEEVHAEGEQELNKNLDTLENGEAADEILAQGENAEGS
jgi:hypothetical protein